MAKFLKFLQFWKTDSYLVITIGPKSYQAKTEKHNRLFFFVKRLIFYRKYKP